MPGLVKNLYGDQPPIGVNNFLRSTKGVLTDSRTVAKDSFPVDKDSTTGQKTLQKGDVIAKITSGADSGKFGVYSTDTVGVTDGRSDIANVVGICQSYYPYQLMDRDVDIAVVYAASVVQANVYVRDATNARVAISNGNVTTLEARKDLDIIWK